MPLLYKSPLWSHRSLWRPWSQFSSGFIQSGFFKLVCLFCLGISNENAELVSRNLIGQFSIYALQLSLTFLDRHCSSIESCYFFHFTRILCFHLFDCSDVLGYRYLHASWAVIHVCWIRDDTECEQFASWADTEAAAAIVWAVTNLNPGNVTEKANYSRGCMHRKSATLAFLSMLSPQFSL